MLGHLALALAERLDALIDFDGLLRCPPSCDDTGDGVLREGAGPLLVSLPGRVTEVSYDSGDGGLALFTGFGSGSLFVKG
ncbi:DUF6368 family protein [Streptomyces sp. NPDC049944]|uniref:DUF6368 family protein n=1 Tax=Streptomyces sp. NPDC049944 TaxID=3155657 RepID=UPI003418CBDD